MSARLPPELLLNIFLAIQETHLWTVNETSPPCMAVSQVCRQWRTVALESSRLWTHIPINSPLWTEACLSRSRSSCLEVSASCIDPEDDIRRVSLMLIYPELTRVSLFQFCVGIRLEEVSIGLSSRPALRLRELNLTILHSISDHSPFRLPMSLFASQSLGSLEHATFFGCELSPSWSKLFLPSTLCSLDLGESYAWKDIDEMVQFFEVIPNLRALRMHTIIADTHTFQTLTSSKHPYRAASLPELEILHVSTRFLEQIAMIAYLSMPTTTLLNIPLKTTDWDLVVGADDVELASATRLGTRALHDHFAPAVAAGHGYTHLRIYSGGVHAPCTSLCELHDNHDACDPYAHIPIELAPIALPFALSTRYPHLFQEAYAMLLEQPVFETATTICISGHLPAAAWSRFERWSTVETLELSNFEDDSALPGFAAAMWQHDFRLFPALRQLCILDCAVVMAQEESVAVPGYHVDGEGLRGTDVRDFVVAVEELAKYEHFERLTLTRCVVSAAVLQTVTDTLGSERVEWRHE